MKRSYIIVLLIIISLSSCMPEAVDFQTVEELPKAGFFSGLWHGLIMPFSFIFSLFDDDVAVYQIGNVGGWYDLGLMLGLSSTFGGGFFGSSRARRRRRTVYTVSQ